MTEKNILAYKLSLSLNISVLSVKTPFVKIWFNLLLPLHKGGRGAQHVLYSMVFRRTDTRKKNGLHLALTIHTIFLYQDHLKSIGRNSDLLCGR